MLFSEVRILNAPRFCKLWRWSFHLTMQGRATDTPQTGRVATACRAASGSFPQFKQVNARKRCTS